VPVEHFFGSIQKLAGLLEMNRQEHRSVLLTPSLRTSSNKCILQESTDSNVNSQSKKLELYKAKLKASVQEKQQLQADHQRLVRRLKELERKNLEKIQQNKQSRLSKCKKQLSTDSGAFSSNNYSKNFQLEYPENFESIENFDVLSVHQIPGILENMELSVTQGFRDSFTPLELRKSLKLPDITEQPKNTKCKKEQRSLQFDSNHKFPDVTSIAVTDERLNEVPLHSDDSPRSLSKEMESKGETIRAAGKTALISEELSMLRDRKKKLEQEICRLKDELSKEEAKRWEVMDQHMQTKRKLCTVMNNWTLFYDQLFQNFLPECRNFLTSLTMPKVGKECLEMKVCELSSANENKDNSANSIREDMQEELSTYFFLDAKNSSNASFFNNNLMSNSSEIFHTSREQLDIPSEKPESKTLPGVENFTYSAEWSTTFNDFVCNHSTVREVCHKLIKEYKNLDYVERKIKGITDKLETRVDRLTCKVAVLRQTCNIPAFLSSSRLFSDCSKLFSAPDSSGSTCNEELANSLCSYQVSQTKKPIFKELNGSESASCLSLCNLELLRKKIEYLESKYSSILAKALVESSLFHCSGHELKSCEESPSIRFLSLLELLLRNLEQVPLSESSFSVHSRQKLNIDYSKKGVVGNSQSDYPQDSCRDVQCSQTFCSFCESLYQENRVLKERIAELEEENSSLADRIF